MNTSQEPYRFSFEPFERKIEVLVDGVTIAESDRGVILRETRLPEAYYLPRNSVRLELAEKTTTTTYCPLRGNASYWRFNIGDKTYEDLMWSYEDPGDDAAAIKNYVAFFPDRVELRLDTPTPLPADPPIFTNPLLGWLLRDAPQCKSGRELTAQFADHLLAVGMTLWRLAVVIRTLHPQVVSFSYRWHVHNRDIQESQATYLTLETPEFLNSPLLPIFEGAGGIRRRLDIPDPHLDFDILKDFRARGATDYVAMPMIFSNGNINALTLASDRPGGFTTSELGSIYEILANLSRLFEVHAMRRTARTLLEVYLGRQAGTRVLQGSVQRGAGERIRAVIWFCDLRRSTSLAAGMDQSEFLTVLNQFFDCMAGAVLQHGGQVLRFIGDAALSIFPISDAQTPDELSMPFEQALDRALAATIEAMRRVNALNTTRETQGLKALGYGIALNIGEVTYGNIGTEDRLEFTVIGDAANRTAKIESLCKKLRQSVLLSADFAQHFPTMTRSLGSHKVPGLADRVPLYTLNESAFEFTGLAARVDAKGNNALT